MAWRHVEKTLGKPEFFFTTKIFFDFINIYCYFVTCMSTLLVFFGLVNLLVISETTEIFFMKENTNHMVHSKKMINKKVLLRERKRHTDRGVSSTPSVVLYWGGGYPLAGGYPPGLDLARVPFLPSRSRQGVPPRRGTPQQGVPPGPGQGAPIQGWMGVPPPCPRLDGGTPSAGPDRDTPPPPWPDLTGVPPQVWTDKVKI